MTSLLIALAAWATGLYPAMLVMARVLIRQGAPPRDASGMAMALALFWPVLPLGHVLAIAVLRLGDHVQHVAERQATAMIGPRTRRPDGT